VFAKSKTQQKSTHWIPAFAGMTIFSVFPKQNSKAWTRLRPCGCHLIEWIGLDSCGTDLLNLLLPGKK